LNVLPCTTQEESKENLKFESQKILEKPLKKKMKLAVLGSLAAVAATTVMANDQQYQHEEHYEEIPE
jgi:hypothetical protein